VGERLVQKLQAPEPDAQQALEMMQLLRTGAINA